MGSLYLFFHVFDTKKEVIEEMISDDEKKFFIVPTTTISFVYFLLSVQEFTLFFSIFIFLIPASRICCTFVLFFFLFLFLLSFFYFFCFKVSLCIFFTHLCKDQALLMLNENKHRVYL